MGADLRTFEALFRRGGWGDVLDAGAGRVRRAGGHARRRVGSNLRTLEAVQRQGGWGDVVRAAVAKVRRGLAGATR